MTNRDLAQRRVVGVPVALWPLILVLVSLAAVSIRAATQEGGTHLRPLVLLPLFLVLFLIAETIQIHIQPGRETHSFSMAEVPLVVGLFYLSPLALVATRVLAAVMVHARRTSGHKLAVNTAVVTAEVSVAAAVFTAVGATRPDDPMAWAAALLAVGLADLTSFGAVLLAITLYESRVPSSAVMRLATSSMAVGILNIAIGLLVVVVLSVHRLTMVLLMVLAVVLVYGYRAYAQFLQQHKSLSELYEFTRAVGTARQDNSLVDTVLTRTRELLNAESAALWMPALGRHPEIALVARADTVGLVDEQLADDPIRRRVVETGQTVHLGPKLGSDDVTLRQAQRARHVKDLIVVPLRSGNAVVGCLEVANRLLRVVAFGPDDVRLVETLAAHAAVAVENSRLVDRLRHDAYHDALTGLPNRRRLLSALTEAIAVAPTPHEVVALLQFDIDSVREVNETLGHGAGERLLAEVGRRLQAKAPDGALVARTGGCEFALLMRARSVEDAQATAVALQFTLAEPFVLDTFTLHVGAAVGIAVHPDHADDAETLLQRADVATYAAKNNPRSIQAYRPAMESRSVHRLGLVSELRRAIEDGALIVHYQPKVGLADRELVGVECLVRWDHPEHGLVPPEDFITVAEHTGLVGALTTRVLRTALGQCRRWHDEGRPIGVSVNLSARSLLDQDFPDELAELLAEAGVPAHQLTLEVAESGMVGDTDRPLPTLRRLFAMGVRLSVDDFGTGYSGLSYLRRLPVQEVKVDRSFVLGMATDSGDLGIVRAVVDLGRHLGMSVVAEGVESEMTLTLLQDMGCDVAQGFLFSRPLPHERLEAWMAARTELTAVSPDGARRLRVVGGHG